MVTGQLNVKVRFVQVGTEHSSFNVDGSRKEKKPVVNEFVKVKDQAAVDRRVQKKGDAGILSCTPKQIVPSGTFKFDPSIQYMTKYVFSKSGQSSNMTAAGVP